MRTRERLTPLACSDHQRAIFCASSLATNNWQLIFPGNWQLTTGNLFSLATYVRLSHHRTHADEHDHSDGDQWAADGVAACIADIADPQYCGISGYGDAVECRAGQEQIVA